MGGRAGGERGKKNKSEPTPAERDVEREKEKVPAAGEREKSRKKKKKCRQRQGEKKKCRQRQVGSETQARWDVVENRYRSSRRQRPREDTSGITGFAPNCSSGTRKEVTAV